MAGLEQYREYIEDIINWRAGIGYAHGNLAMKPVFDRNHDQYLLMVIGYEGRKQVHFALIDVELRDGKFWIHYDGTEAGVATYLLEKGVPREHIVLAFKSPEMRKYTEFAAA